MTFLRLFLPIVTLVFLITPEVVAQEVLIGHTDVVSDAVFSPDGSLVATASYDGIVRIWRADDLSLRDSLIGHTARVTSVIFSPDGARILTVGDEPSLRIWSVATGDLIANIPAASRVRFADYNGDLIAAAVWNGTIGLYDGRDGRPIDTLYGHTSERLFAVTIGPNGRYVASGGNDSTIILWDRSSGEAVREIRGHTGFISVVRFNPDGDLLASADYAGGVRISRVNDGGLEHELLAHGDRVRTLDFSVDGARLLSSSFDATARIYDVAAGQEIASITTHERRLRAASFSPDGRLVVTASEDGSAGIHSGLDGRPLRPLFGHRDRLFTARFSPDGQSVVSASYDSTARVWDVGDLAGVGHSETGMEQMRVVSEADRVFVTPAEEAGRFSLLVFDVLGREIERQENLIGTAALSTAALQPGTYLCSVRSVSGFAASFLLSVD